MSSDHHCDEHGRWDEFLKVHRWMLQVAREQQVDAFLSGGDIYERASTPKEREEVSTWLVQMANICPVYIARGNHDRQLDCQIMSKLAADHLITVCEDHDIRYVGNTAIAMFAWPERAHIMAHAQRLGVDPDEVSQNALQWLFRGVANELAEHDGPKLALGHFMVDGSVTSVGQPLLGQPMRVGLDDFDLLGVHAVLMGHIHKPQEWLTPAGTRVAYAGSPFRTSYGEVEDKSVLLIDVNDDGITQWQRIKTPCAGMHLVSERWAYYDLGQLENREPSFGGGPEAHLAPEDVPGSEIRFRYTVAPDQRDAARAAACQWQAVWRSMGALAVKIEEEVLTTAVARAPEVAAAATLPDKLMALWNARQAMPEPARVTRLLSKVGELERAAS